MKPHNVKVTAVFPVRPYTDSWKGTDLPEERFIDSRDVAESIWSVYAFLPGQLSKKF
jgi:hypothetical protein